MATQSILRNIVIEEPIAAERFITALEEAAEASKKSSSTHIEYENLKGEAIKNFLGALIE